MPGIHPMMLSARWLDGADTATVGARFASDNVHNTDGVWQATSRIVHLQPPRSIAWTIESSIAPPAVCRFDILADPGSNGETSVLRQTYYYDTRPGASPPITHALTHREPEPPDTHSPRRPR